MRSPAAAALLLLSALPCGAQVDTVLQRQLEARVAGRGVTAGIAVMDVPSGRRAEVNGGARFTMMSVYKFPIALAVLRRASQGRFYLDSVLVLRPSDRRPGPGRAPLSTRIPATGLRMSLQALIEAAVVESDNTASDFLFRFLGRDVINQEVALAGGRGIRIDRQEGELALDFSGARLRPGETPTPEAIAAARSRVPEAARAAAARRFPLDARDTATPMAMAELLVSFSHGDALSPRKVQLLRGMMERTVTGPNRLRAGLPPGVRLAHRTGTAGGSGETLAAVNDVGIIAIPGHGDVAVAVFVRSAPEGAAEQLIADVARIVYARYAPRRPISTATAARR